MKTAQSTNTLNIRIPQEIHEQIKMRCRRDGLLMGSYVAKILSAAISAEEEKETLGQDYSEPKHN
jgi:hypothetical protein